MIEVAQDLDLPVKSCFADGGRYFGSKDLYRDRMLSLQIVCEDDVGRSTFTDFLPEDVSFGQRRCEVFYSRRAYSSQAAMRLLGRIR